MAETYPSSVFVLDNGEIVLDYWGYKGPKEAITGRQRSLTDVAIPASALRKGVNVLAIEVIRAPYDKSVAEYWDKSKRKEGRELGEAGLPYDFNWYTCEMREVKLTAAGAAGPGAQCGAAEGTAGMEQRRADLRHLRGRGRSLRGAASGRHQRPAQRLVVGQGGPWLAQGHRGIEGHLRRPQAGRRRHSRRRDAGPLRAWRLPTNPTGKEPLESLLETPLESFPVIGGGAVVPIWLTVKVPANAKPGLYTGQATDRGQGREAARRAGQPSGRRFRRARHAGLQDLDRADAVARHAGRGIQRAPVVRQALGTDRPVDALHRRDRQPRGDRPADRPDQLRQLGVHGPLDQEGRRHLRLRSLDRRQVPRHGGQEHGQAQVRGLHRLGDLSRHARRRKSPTANPNGEAAWLAARWDLRGKGPAATALDPKTGQTSTFNLPRSKIPTPWRCGSPCSTACTRTWPSAASRTPCCWA